MKAEVEAAVKRTSEPAYTREQQDIAEEEKAALDACTALATEFGSDSTTLPGFEMLMVPQTQPTLIDSSDGKEEKEMDTKSIDSQTEEALLVKQEGEELPPPSFVCL